MSHRCHSAVLGMRIIAEHLFGHHVSFAYTMLENQFRMANLECRSPRLHQKAPSSSTLDAHHDSSRPHTPNPAALPNTASPVCLSSRTYTLPLRQRHKSSARHPQPPPRPATVLGSSAPLFESIINSWSRCIVMRTWARRRAGLGASLL